MYSAPSKRRSKPQENKKLNLVPILDSVFILIFFLLLSAQFIKIYEISSNVPIVSSKPPPKTKKPPLSLTLEITEKKIIVLSGQPLSRKKEFSIDEEGEFPLDELHSFLIEIKKKNKTENTVIFEPTSDVEYEQIVKIMDSVRSFKKTDESVYGKDADGVDIVLEYLFEDIIFGNITS